MADEVKQKSQIEILEEKIKQLENRKKNLIQKEKSKERKERTRRLIEIGAIFEKYLDIHTTENAEKFCKDYVLKNPQWKNK